MTAERLCEFIAAVRRRTSRLLDDDRFPEDQRRGLEKTVDRFFSLADPSDWAQPLGLLYASYRAFGRKTDEQTTSIGAFCVFYLTSADLFDDVQDDDLAGKPLATAGAPIAINSALALLLVGLRALHEGALLEADPARRSSYLDVFTRVSLVAIGAQHADLAGLGTAATPDAVLAMNRGKTSSVALLAECGALLGGASAAEVGVFRDFGSDFAALVQIVDDVRDVFGKTESPDLLAGKVTYPIACFLETADQADRDDFVRLSARLPESAEALRELLYGAGAVDASASAVEDLRQTLHGRLARLPAPRAEHRLLLSMVDALASTLYEPEPVALSLSLFAPTGGFHDDIQLSSARFLDKLGLIGVLPTAQLAPWQAPLYLFEPATCTIRYPDLQELADEIIGQFSDTLGLERCVVEPAMKAGMPLLLAHELFHAWRHTLGRLSADAWHEEFVANRLAMGYALRFEPEAARATLEMSRFILELSPAEAGENAILERARHQGEPADYDLSFRGAARVHARMLLDAALESDFDSDRIEWLQQESASAGETAATALAAE